ncbi:hypothetical protein [Thalassospira lucentensis]|uniref:hypothetical protein n=1 Tax=Thalassospira lucentensis TaxID=168935 RepID=UPI003AA9B1AF
MQGTETIKSEKKHIGIWAGSFQALWACRSWCVIALLLSVLTDYVLDGDDYILCVNYLVYLAIRTLVCLPVMTWMTHSSENFNFLAKLKWNTLRCFIQYYVLLDLIVIVPVVLTFSLITGRFFPSVQYMSQPENMSAVVVSAVIALAIQWMVFVFLSTILPAALTQDSDGIRRAIARGRKTAWSVTSRTLIGPLAWSLGCAIVVDVFQSIATHALMTFEISPEDAFAMNLATALNLVLTNIQFVVLEIMLAVIIVGAYQLGEARLVNDSAPNAETEQSEAT